MVGAGFQLGRSFHVKKSPCKQKLAEQGERSYLLSGPPTVHSCVQDLNPEEHAKM